MKTICDTIVAFTNSPRLQIESSLEQHKYTENFICNAGIAFELQVDIGQAKGYLFTLFVTFFVLYVRL